MAWARLGRHDLFDVINAGRLKPKTAARQAGLIKELTALEQIQRLLLKLSAKERRELRQLLAE
jgi:hypothetical protein